MPPPGGARASMQFEARAMLQGQSRVPATWTPADVNAFNPPGSVFGPGLPMVPPDPRPTRLLDFNVGTNATVTPRSAEFIGFAGLRAFANVEPVRLAIETCKDQIEKLDWQIKARDAGKGAKAGAARAADGRIKTIEKFFRKPDGQTHFATWQREWLEDLLVLDAPTIEKRRDRGGQLIGLDIIPGDTIKLLVDDTGRRPVAPIPAFQQVIKGRVWNNLTTADLIYAPRNPRPGKMYGFGPVEQIVVTINIVIRRQAMQLGHFTEGNVPAGILNAPAGWGPDNIKTMQDAWDARMEGNIPGKSKLLWVPDGTGNPGNPETPTQTAH